MLNLQVGNPKSQTREQRTMASLIRNSLSESKVVLNELTISFSELRGTGILTTTHLAPSTLEHMSMAASLTE